MPAVGKRPFAFEVIEGFATVPGDRERVLDARRLQGHAHEKHVRFLIFNQQNRFIHAAFN